MSTTIAKEKTTIYLNPYVKKFLQHKAVNENSSLSDIINEEFADLLEDVEFAQKSFEGQTNQVFKPWDEVKKQLAADGLL
jgi:hypothetical protein